MQSIVIPDNIVSIGHWAFDSCSKLQSIVLGAGLTNIDRYDSYDYIEAKKVFWLCNTLPSGYSALRGEVNYVASDKYKFLSSMFSVGGIVYVPTSFSERTCIAVDYSYDKQVADISIPETVTYDGVEMKVESVGAYTFSNAPIRSVKIGNSIAELPKGVFWDCSELTSIVIPTNICSIGDYAFKGCTSLRNLTMDSPDAVDADDTLILGSNGSSPMFRDTPIEEVYIGRNISYDASSSCGYSPFYRNTSLKSVTITDAETEILANEFYGCTNLKSIKIGDGVEKINDYAFSGCSSLEFFSIGKNVKRIGREAFSDCTGLTKFYTSAIVPPVCGQQALDDINKWNCILYVPSVSTAVYSAASQWKEFVHVESL